MKKCRPCANCSQRPPVIPAPAGPPPCGLPPLPGRCRRDLRRRRGEVSVAEHDAMEQHRRPAGAGAGGNQRTQQAGTALLPTSFQQSRRAHLASGMSSCSCCSTAPRGATTLSDLAPHDEATVDWQRSHDAALLKTFLSPPRLAVVSRHPLTRCAAARAASGSAALSTGGSPPLLVGHCTAGAAAGTGAGRPSEAVRARTHVDTAL